MIFLFDIVNETFLAREHTYLGPEIDLYKIAHYRESDSPSLRSEKGNNERYSWECAGDVVTFISIAFSPREITAVPLHSNGNDSVYPQTSTSNATGRWISSFSLPAPNSTVEMVIYTNDRSSLEWNRARLWDIFFNPVVVRDIFLFLSTMAVNNISIVFKSFHDDS